MTRNKVRPPVLIAQSAGSHELTPHSYKSCFITNLIHSSSPSFGGVRVRVGCTWWRSRSHRVSKTFSGWVRDHRLGPGPNGPAPVPLPSQILPVHVVKVRDLTLRLNEAGCAYGSDRR